MIGIDATMENAENFSKHSNQVLPLGGRTRQTIGPTEAGSVVRSGQEDRP